MTGLLLEGFESALLPCSLVLLVPGAAAVVAARDRTVAALAGFASAAAVLAWLRFSLRGGGWPAAVVAAALVAAAFLLVLPQLRREQLPAVAAGALSGAAAAELWEPCVGADFGRLLNELPGQSVIGLGSLAVYLVGVLSPLAALAALVALVPDRLSAARPHVANAGAAVLALAAFTIAAGLEDEVVGHLVRWST